MLLDHQNNDQKGINPSFQKPTNATNLHRYVYSHLCFLAVFNLNLFTGASFIESSESLQQDRQLCSVLSPDQNIDSGVC